MAVVIGIVVALVVALGVLLLVGATLSDDERSGHPWRSLRDGLAARRHPTPEQEAAQAAAEVEPVDVTIDDFFAATADDGDPYLRPEELGAPLHRVGRRTGRGAAGGTADRTAQDRAS